MKIRPDHPYLPYVHNNLGATLVRAGRFSEAIEQLEQALKIKPNYPEAHNNLGKALLLTGHVREAIAQFEQALKIKPDYAGAHDNLVKAQGILKSIQQKSEN